MEIKIQVTPKVFGATRAVFEQVKMKEYNLYGRVMSDVDTIKTALIMYDNWLNSALFNEEDDE